MKVGDLIHCDYGFGIVVAKALQHDGPLYRVVFTRFPAQRIWCRPDEMTVIS